MELFFLPLVVASIFVEARIIGALQKRLEMNIEDYGKRALVVFAGWVVFALFYYLFGSLFPRDAMVNDSDFVTKYLIFLPIAVFLSFGVTMLFSNGKPDRKTFILSAIHAIIMLILFAFYTYVFFTQLVIPAFEMLGGSSPNLH